MVGNHVTFSDGQRRGFRLACTHQSIHALIAGDAMQPENPEALLTIIIAGLGYGVYIGGEALQKRRADPKNADKLPVFVPVWIKWLGGAMMIIPVGAYVVSWVIGWF